MTTLRKFAIFPLALFCLLSTALVGAEDPKAPAKERARPEAKGFKNVGVDEFDRLRSNKQNQVLDVRTAGEFAQGHLPGAVNIDVNGPDFDKQIAALPKDKTYLVHCAGGVRSAKACSKMSHINFSQLYNLEGGLKAWEKAGKPVEK